MGKYRALQALEELREIFNRWGIVIESDDTVESGVVMYFDTPSGWREGRNFKQISGDEIFKVLDRENRKWKTKK